MTSRGDGEQRLEAAATASGIAGVHDYYEKK
jgi:hypothetical protein